MPGRTTEPRSIVVTKTTGSATITTTDTFGPEDVGRTVTGSGVPAGSTILAVTAATTATLSANATATGSSTMALGPAEQTAAGFIGWSPESPSEAASYSVAAVTTGTATPDRITDAVTPVIRRGR